MLFLQVYMGSTRVGQLSEMVEPVLGGYQKWKLISHGSQRGSQICI